MAPTAHASAGWATPGDAAKPRPALGPAPAAAMAPLSTILIRGLRARCVIGIRPWERRRRQTVVLDIAFEADLSLAAGSDDVRHTIDYKEVKDRVLAHVEASRYNLLEALAASVADLVVADARVSSCDVTVDKPGALRKARSVAVRVARRRAP